MRLRLLSVLLFAPALSGLSWGQVDPAVLIRESVVNYEQNWRESSDWAYEQTDRTLTDDIKTTTVSQVTPIDGSPYERVISRDGHALYEDEARAEMRKMHKVERERKAETPEQRAARIAKYKNQRSFVRDIPEAYTFRLLGEDTVNGRPAWVIELTPRPGFVPREPHAAMLSHIAGKLWIDKEDLSWAKAEAHVVDPISIGWIMARIGPGTDISLEQTRVAPGFWMAKEITIHGLVKVFLVHDKPLNEQISYADFRRVNQNGTQISKAARQPGEDRAREMSQVVRKSHQPDQSLAPAGPH